MDRGAVAYAHNNDKARFPWRDAASTAAVAPRPLDRANGLSGASLYAIDCGTTRLFACTPSRGRWSSVHERRAAEREATVELHARQQNKRTQVLEQV